MTTQRPTVSVIVTCYNQVRYITTTIRSICAQTYTDFEIIVVDDGSTDGSLDMLTAIQQEYHQNIRICTHAGHVNRGITETYSLGIEKAQAPYVAFLEGDDEWSLNYLAEKIPIFQHFPEVGVVFSPCKIQSEGSYGADMVFRQKVLQVLFPKKRPFSNFNQLLRHNNVATFSTFMVRTSLLRNLPKTTTSRLPYLDWWTLLQSSMRSDFYFDQNSFIGWRVSKSSFMASLSFQDHKSSLISFFDELYSSVDEGLACLDEKEICAFKRKKRSKPFFIAFYSEPSVSGFLRLFSHDPRWAVESLASYAVNSLKHARNPTSQVN